MQHVAFLAHLNSYTWCTTLESKCWYNTEIAAHSAELLKCKS